MTYANIITPMIAAAYFAGAPASALARSAALPGVTVGLPAGWQVPTGLQFNLTTTIGNRGTKPRDSRTNVNVAVFLWATPWTVFGGQLLLAHAIPFNSVSPQETPWQAGLAQQITGAQVGWKIGDYVGVSYFLGGFYPTDSTFAMRNASIVQRVAISYVEDGWNLTANLHHGTMVDDTSPMGEYYADHMNLDLTATKRIGKWSAGAVAYGSADLPARRLNHNHVGQIAVGGLVGYAFDRFTLQTIVSRDVAERNYGGRETRVMLRILAALWQPEADQVPNRLRVRRSSAAD